MYTSNVYVLMHTIRYRLIQLFMFNFEIRIPKHDKSNLRLV